MIETPPNYPPYLAAIAAIVAEELQKRLAIDAASANEIALMATERVRAEWGGAARYLPKGQAVDIDRRNWEMYAKFRGSYEEIAREYKLTEQRVRQIIDECIEEERRRRQAPLFPS